MKIRLDDIGAMQALRPLELAAYLRAHGWREIDPGSPAHRVSVWIFDAGDDVTEILVPKEPRFRDYGARVRSVIRTLGEVERRSELAIVRDIGEVTSDVVRLRAEEASAATGTIGLLDGLQLATSARAMMLAAACAADAPKRAYHTRKPAAAVNYVETLKLGQTEPGSFVLTIVSVVGPALAAPQQMALEGMSAPPPDPFPRRVTRTLTTALAAMADAAERGAATGELTAFEEAVPLGVSADLCEALGALRAHTRVEQLDVSVSWSPSRPSPTVGRPLISFQRDAMDVVQEAGRVLRERAPIEDFELFGIVTGLNRPETDLNGTATVAGTIDGRPRKVLVELWGDDWREAHRLLHDREHAFRCVGELVRQGTTYRLKNPREVQSVPLEAASPT